MNTRCGKCSWSGGRSARTTHVAHVMSSPHTPLHHINVARKPFRHPTYIAPSWSWASINGVVRCHVKGRDGKPHVVVPEEATAVIEKYDIKLSTPVIDMGGDTKYPNQYYPKPWSPMGPTGQLGIAVTSIRPSVAVAPHCFF
jgi:hypothetical protein